MFLQKLVRQVKIVTYQEQHCKRCEPKERSDAGLRNNRPNEILLNFCELGEGAQN